MSRIAATCASAPSVWNARRAPSSGIALLSALLAGAPSAVQAQICFGTPSGGGVEYNYQKLSVGSSNGVIGTLAGSHFAVGVGARAVTINSDDSGLEGNLRLSGVLGISRLKLCPGISINYNRDKWDAAPGVSLTSHSAALGAGVGIGYEQPIVQKLSIIPFASLGYQFKAIYYDLKATNSEVDVTGDTLSGVAMQYGVVAHYSFAYAGFSANRTPELKGKHPSSVQWIVGVTFSGKGARNVALAARSRDVVVAKASDSADQTPPFHRKP